MDKESRRVEWNGVAAQPNQTIAKLQGVDKAQPAAGVQSAYFYPGKLCASFKFYLVISIWWRYDSPHQMIAPSDCPGYVAESGFV